MRPLAACAVALVFGAAAAGCGTGGLSEGGNASAGKSLFNEKCASCHALADAGSQGQIGPDLDEAFERAREEGFGESTIREVVAKQIAYPLPPTASPDVPPMPKDLVKGDDADAVATYVASVAGEEGAAAGGGGGAPAGNDPKAIFTSSGCGGCHVFEAAGGTGTVGPNLDESKPSAEESAQQIRKGGGGMPAFEGRLTDEQIQALADFIAKNAGKGG